MTTVVFRQILGVVEKARLDAVCTWINHYPKVDLDEDVVIPDYRRYRKGWLDYGSDCPFDLDWWKYNGCDFDYLTRVVKVMEDQKVLWDIETGTERGGNIALFERFEVFLDSLRELVEFTFAHIELFFGIEEDEIALTDAQLDALVSVGFGCLSQFEKLKDHPKTSWVDADLESVYNHFRHEQF